MNEAALIHDAQKGDLDAYNTLVLHYQEQAYNIAYRIMGDVDSAADATQDAFISAYRAIRQFKGGSFKSWLFRIITNECYDELRKKRRRPQTSLDALYTEHTSPDLALHTHQENPEKFTIRRELQRAIKVCLDTLPDDQKAIAILSDIEGFNYLEISEIVGVALGTVKSRLSRARLKLRGCLQGFGELIPEEYRQ